MPVATQFAASPRPAQVTPTPVAALALLARGRLIGPDVRVTGMTANSGQVRPGDLFAAVPGRSGHGARFAAAAVESGAVAVLTDEAGAAVLAATVPVVVADEVRTWLGPVAAAVYGTPSSSLAVAGVTGTSGKTTTTYLVRAGLNAAGRTSGLIGTVGTVIGDETFGPGLTTPEAPDLQALLAVMVERGVDGVAMEVSSHALALHRADGIEFAVGAFTNLSQDHLDFHADMAEYFAAKARLFDGRSRTPIVVVDDEWGRRLVRPETITVDTLGAVAMWQARDVQDAAAGGTAFRAVGPGVDVAAGSVIPGRYNVVNALLALAILDALGVPADVAAPAVRAATVPGRMERVDAGQPYLAVVDYSHKPAAVAGALTALRRQTRGRLIVVLGCGGDRDQAKRAVMGEVAARGADLLVVTDDNPRSEDPAVIRAAVRAGALGVPASQRGEVVEVGDRAAAIATAVAAASPGDAVLVAGKGHETGQEVGGVTYPFDDRVALRRAITAASR